jgi:hypothetical protein
VNTFIRASEVWVPSADRTMLEFGGGLYGKATRFGALSRNLCFGRGEGLPGQAWEQGRPLVLRTRNLEIRADDPRVDQGLEPGAYVELIVSDTGTGMAPGVVDHAFEPFFSTKPKSEGTGLGLSVAASIVRNHGGDISLRSTEGQGTRVTVLWPVAGSIS